MAWFEAHQTLGKHPKTLKLARLIHKERRYAVGMLHDLFSWGLDSARKDGTLPGMTSDDIASALDFTGKTGESVVNALVESGYLELADGTYKIHDWYEYAGKLADKREADKNRKRDAEGKRISDGKQSEIQRNSDGIPTEIRRTSDGIPIATVPNTGGSSTIRAHAPAHTREDEPEDKNDLGRVMDFFMDRINPTPSPMAVDFLKGYTETLGADVVIHALGIALDERKTGWSYIHAILQRYERDGLKTMDAVLRDEQERTARKAAPPTQTKQEKPSQVKAQGFASGEGFKDMDALLAGLEAI